MGKLLRLGKTLQKGIHLKHRKLCLTRHWFVSVRYMSASGNLFLYKKTNVQYSILKVFWLMLKTYHVSVIAIFESGDMRFALGLVKVIILQASHHVHHLCIACQFWV